MSCQRSCHKLTDATNVQLVNLDSRHVITVDSKDLHNNQVVSISPSKLQEDVNQLWDLEYIDGKRFYIISKLNTEFVLSANDSDKSSIVLSERKTPPAIHQLWEWHGVALKSAVGNNQVLSVSSNGNKLTLETVINGHLNQSWEVQKMLWDEVKSGWMPAKEATGAMPFITD